MPVKGNDTQDDFTVLLDQVLKRGIELWCLMMRQVLYVSQKEPRHFLIEICRRISTVYFAAAWHGILGS